MTAEITNSLEFLNHSIEKIPEEYITIYKSIINSLTYITLSTLVRTRQNRFILDKDFYHTFTTLKFYSELTISEQLIYDCFKYCIDNNFFNEASIYYPFAKTVAKINKYHTFLNEKNFSIIEEIDEFIENTLNNIEAIGELHEESLFIILTICNYQKISKQDLYKITKENSFMRKGILYFIFFDEIDNSDFQPFRVVKINEEYANYVNQILQKNGSLFKLSYKELISKSKRMILKFFKSRNVNRNIVRQAVINRAIYKFETPVDIALKYNKIQTVPVILSELEALEKNSVPEKFLSIERNNIDYKRKNSFDDEFDDFSDIFLDNNGFDYEKHIEPLFYFNYKQRILNFTSIDKMDFKRVYAEIVIEAFNRAAGETDDDSVLLVINFMLVYLKKILMPKGKGIEFSTFKQYVSVIKSNFLVYYDDLNTFDETKIEMLIGILQRQKKSESTINRLLMLIHTMIGLDKSEILKHKLINTMPKSLVFDFEIDKILDKIKYHYKELAKKKNAKTNTKHLNYIILQEQVFVLLLFYTGLRKTELRTRLHNDIVIENYDIYTGEKIHNGYTCFVNLDGVKIDKLSKRLKTGNSKRKVFFRIKDENHLVMVKSFIEQSKNISDRFVFKEFILWKSQKNLSIKKSAINYRNIEHLNGIIQNVTNRYTSMHSLRASFATYRYLYLFSNTQRNNTDLFNFSIEIGHQGPGITFKHYIHYHLIGEL